MILNPVIVNNSSAKTFAKINVNHLSGYMSIGICRKSIIEANNEGYSADNALLAHGVFAIATDGKKLINEKKSEEALFKIHDNAKFDIRYIKENGEINIMDTKKNDLDSI